MKLVISLPFRFSHSSFGISFINVICLILLPFKLSLLIYGLPSNLSVFDMEFPETSSYSIFLSLRAGSSVNLLEDALRMTRRCIFSSSSIQLIFLILLLETFKVTKNSSCNSYGIKSIWLSEISKCCMVLHMAILLLMCSKPLVARLSVL